LFPGQIASQFKVSSGIIDFITVGDLDHPIIIEAKLTQTADAYYQLERYARCFIEPCVRAVVTKTVVRTISTPERPTYLQHLADLRAVAPGYYVIPFDGKILA